MKVLLVSTNTVTEPYPTYPIGLDYVINAISPPHEARAVDMNELADVKSLAEILTQFSPDIIGLSIRNIDNTDAAQVKTFVGEFRKLTDAVREHSTGYIVLGGSGFTILPGEFMSTLDADFGVIGEGERLQLLLDALENNKSTSGIPGIVHKNGPVILPEPWSGNIARRFFADHSYNPFYLKRGGMMNLQTKRGCPFKCIYCTYPHIEGAKFRFAEPAEAARTARRLQDAGARYLYITDSTFNGSYEHSTDIAAAFAKAGLSIPWGGFFTPTAPPKDFYRKLAQAGLTHVEFGTEALCDTMLRSYKKPFKIEDVYASHRAALEAGLHVAHYFMLGGPEETRETLKETLANADYLERSAFFIFNGVRIYPHTPLCRLARREGQIEANRSLLEPVFYWSRALHREEASSLVQEHTDNRGNWVVGAASGRMSKIVAKMHARGHIGPLWEKLIP